jgi:hypothetical protein
MGRRRLLALAVLLPILEPATVGLSAWASTRPHECSEHACFCARRCPPKRAKSDCHGTARPEAAMTGRCHLGEAPRLGAITPYVLPAPPETGPAWQEEPADLAVREDASPGFSRLDSPPPRSV